MKDNKFEIHVDIKEVAHIPKPLVRQNDDVYFEIHVTDDGIPYSLSNVTTVTIVTERSDEVAVVSPSQGILDNVVTFRMPRSAVSMVGSSRAAVQMYEDGRVTTLNFGFEVIKDPAGNNWVPSDGEMTLIEIVLGEGPGVIQDAKDATQEANDATGDANSIIDDMNVLKTETEEVRDSTKAVKEETEEFLGEARVDVSEAVQEAYDAADKAEQERLDTKEEREATEAVRGATEDVRSATEAVRTDTLAVKEDTEAERIATKSEREATEGVRQSTEALKVETEGVRDSTLEAKEFAEEATGVALEAATGADDAAEYANVQGKRAEDAADLVDVILEDGPVTAVNGKTGNVVLGAEDIEGVSEILVESKEYTDDSHKYGGKFEWRYNSATDSLDLVVIE